MSAVPQPSRLTPGDFLAWEAAQEGKHEFVDGEVFAMSGGSKVHKWIAMNIAHALRPQLAPLGCRALTEHQVQVDTNIVYPDVTVACGADARSGGVIAHPRHVFEVLSNSTESYDRGKKRKLYQDHLPGLQTYVLVAQHGVMVEVLRRTRDSWTSELYLRLEDVVELGEPPCRLTLAEIYDGALDLVDGSTPPA
jgi:Uma2 family endonuclease